MKNVIPYNLFEMSKYQIQDYYPYFLEIERLVKTGEYKRYVDFPHFWKIKIETDPVSTTASKFITTHKDGDFKDYRSVQLFYFSILEKDVYVRFSPDYIIIKIPHIEEREIPLVVVKDAKTFFKRIKKEVEEYV
jgi:hypothetical protein